MVGRYLKRIDGCWKFAIHLRPPDPLLLQPPHDVIAMAFTDTFTGAEQNEIGLTRFCPPYNLTQLTKPFVVISYFDTGPVIENIFIAKILEPHIAAFAQQLCGFISVKALGPDISPDSYVHPQNAPASGIPVIF